MCRNLQSVPTILAGIVAFVLSFIILQKHFRFKIIANDFQAYIVLLGSS